MFLSPTQSLVSSPYSLVSHTGIYGVLGFQKGTDTVFIESGSMRTTVSLDTYSAEYLGLWYDQTLYLSIGMDTHGWYALSNNQLPVI